MELYELMETIELSVERYINSRMTQIVPARDNIGLDPRAAYTLYISPEAIAVPKHEDRTLQYYGGFEYVDTEFRKELGDYVFYMYDDGRVADHIDRFNRSEEEDAA